MEAIAEIHNRTDKLKKWEMSEAETQQEEIAEVVEIEHQGRAKNVLFSDRHIPIGSVLTCVDDPSIVCTVVNDRMVEYNGEIMYATQFARLVSGKPWLTTGPGYVADHFTYEGELIRTRQKRLDAEKSD